MRRRFGLPCTVPTAINMRLCSGICCSYADILSSLCAISTAEFCTPCSDKPSELGVEVVSDLIPTLEFSAVTVELNGALVESTPVSRRDDYFRGVRVADLRDVAARPNNIVKVSLKNIDDETVAESALSVSTTADLTVRLTVTRSCVGVVCGDTETCTAGECVDIACEDDDCPTAECVTASDCGGVMQSCLTVACSNSVCIWPQAIGVCGASEFCSSEDGCTPIPTSSCEAGCDDGRECTDDACVNGSCLSTPKTDGTVCSLGVCQEAICVSPSCSDFQFNGDETDTDCGGSCVQCGAENLCKVNDDCQSGVCEEVGLEKRCAIPTCADGVRNQDETQIDCGGGCGLCPLGSPCSASEECSSRSCQTTCRLATCSDGIQNQNELRIDCGGECDECPPIPFSCSDVTSISMSECDALVAVYSTMGGDSWSNSLNWLDDLDPCSWYGVVCMGGGVEVLSLGNNNLTGSIPPEISQLTGLEQLWLDENQLSGTLPAELGTMGLVTLSLFDNQLSGPIPDELGNMSSLQYLFLSKNRFSSSIPASLGNLTNLQDLHLGINQFSSVVPASFGNLTALTSLRLEENQLTSPLPSALQGMSSLKTLTLYENSFDETLPEWISQMTTLNVLALGKNAFQGSIPASYSSLSHLSTFSVSENQLVDSVPDLSGMVSLREFVVHENELTGAFPTFLSTLPELLVIELGSNNFSGPLPATLTSGPLQRLMLYDNQFSGAVPSSIGTLDVIQELNLSSNQLSGTVPASITNVPDTASVTIAWQRTASCFVADAATAAWLEARDPSWDSCVN